jgi:protein-S-isoprenylcysteine O-methyltransferase Ste14
VKALLLAVASTNFSLFTWAALRFFRIPSSGTPKGMRAIQVFGLIFMGLHLYMLASSSVTTSPGALIGAGLYGSALLIFLSAIAVNRRRPLGIAFQDSGPSHLVDTGPYRWIRHPFYTSYTLAWVAGPLATGAHWLWLTVGVMFGFYWAAATREERQFAQSSLTVEHDQYRQGTGMFIPKVRFTRRTRRRAA